MKFNTNSAVYFKLIGLFLTALAGSLAACSYTNGYQAPSPCGLPSKVSYQTDVLPILQQNCFRCHDATHYKGAPPAGTNGTLNMEDFKQLSLYATTGVKGTSYLIGVTRHDAGFIPMPYDGGQLTECQIATLKAWVEAGAANN